jgi:hypothetical protein
MKVVQDEVLLQCLQGYIVHIENRATRMNGQVREQSPAAASLKNGQGPPKQVATVLMIGTMQVPSGVRR